MASSDPWFDWWIDFGNFEGFSSIPPEIAALVSPNGEVVGSWEDENGNVVLPPLPLPPLPPSAPACARQAYQDWQQGIGNTYLAAKNNCPESDLVFGFNRLTVYPGPPFRLEDFVITGVSNGTVFWGDPCASFQFRYPPNCDYFDNFFGGNYSQGCPQDYQPNTLFSPGAHRVISEIQRPTGRAFLWRLAYDQPVLWSATVSEGLISGQETCQSYALAISLQLEALQEIIDLAVGETVFLQFGRYFDGILSGIQYKVFEGETQLGQGLIGYNRNLEFAFCTGSGIFREDVGRTPCDNGDEDDMGCDCEQIVQILQEEIAQLKQSHLDKIKEDSGWLRNLWEPIEDRVTEFFAVDAENSWTRFLSRFSLLSGFLRPSGTEPDTVISPPLPDRIAEAFERSKARQRAIWTLSRGFVRVLVRFRAIEGERITSRDTSIPPASLRPYNHFGQVWLEYAVGFDIRQSNWQWIRSRESEHLFVIPDLRTSPTDNFQVSARYQLFAGLETNEPLVEIFLPELLTADYWQASNGGESDPPVDG